MKIKHIVNVNKNILRYAYNYLFDDQMEWRVEIDKELNNSYALFSLKENNEIVSEIEAYFNNEGAFGRKNKSNKVFKLDEEYPIPDHLELVLKLLEENKPTTCVEKDEFWIIEFSHQQNQSKENLMVSFRELRELVSISDKKYERINEFITDSDIKIRQKVFVSKKNNKIIKYSNNLLLNDIDYCSTVTFSSLERGIRLIEGDEFEIIDAPKIPFSMLFLEMPTLGGWNINRTHVPWVTQSIHLIREKDFKDKKYLEIYDPVWYAIDPKNTNDLHPIALGASKEDETEVFPPFYKSWLLNEPSILSTKNFYDDYKRSVNHFGIGRRGLEKRWYFLFYGAPDPHIKDDDGNHDFFSSAMDWGYGKGRVDERLNKMTFSEAIKQYNNYTLEGKRNAFLMLGHVVHLLQDIGQPDHAKRVAHPASAFDEPEAYSKFGHCFVVATLAQAAAWMFPVVAFAVAYAVCRETADEDEVGYEKLIDLETVDNWQKPEYNNLNIISHDKSKKPLNYDTFFETLSKFSIKKADDLGLGSPLGLGRLAVPPHVLVPGLNPDIQSDDPDSYLPFYNLTDALHPKIIGMTAGFIQHFYEIVNHPPYLKRIVVIKGPNNSTPKKFGKLKGCVEGIKVDEKFGWGGEGYTNCKVCYDVEWEDVNQFILRQKKIGNGKGFNELMLSPNHETYFFLQFGPTINNKSKILKEDSIELVLKSKKNILKVKLQIADDPQIGKYYWGSIKLKNETDVILQYQIIVNGKDASAHYKNRYAIDGTLSPSGEDLDADPSIKPTVNTDHPLCFPWENYKI